MPSYMFGEFLNTLISVHFPGGKLGWTRAAGEAFFVPVPAEKDVLYILVPEEAAQELDLGPFRRALEETCTKKDIRLRWVDKTVAESNDAHQIVNLAVMLSQRGRPVYMSVSRAVLVLNMPKDTKEQAAEVLDLLADFRLRRVMIVGSNFSLNREYEVSEEKEAVEKQARVVQEPTRDHVITKDDVTNLTILIESAATVEDLLNSL